MSEMRKNCFTSCYSQANGDTKMQNIDIHSTSKRGEQRLHNTSMAEGDKTRCHII